MAQKHFRPKAGRFGIMVGTVRGRLATTVAGTATTNFNIGGLHRRGYVERVSLSCLTVIASASAVTATVNKYNASTNAAVALTAGFDLKSLVTEETTALPLLTTLTDAERTLAEGDTIRIAIVAAGAISTQPVDLHATVEVAVQE